MNAALKSIPTSLDASDERWRMLQASFAGMRSGTTELVSLAQRSLHVAPIIIVGAGPAAQECARQISASMRGDEWLLMFNGEQYLPYHRAQLSTALSTCGRVDTLLTHAFAQNVVIAHAANVAVIDPKAKKLYTDNGIEFHYRQLVLATGSQPRRPVIPGLHGSRVFDFRQLADIAAIAALAPQRVAVLGGGLLGIEAARALREFCEEVTIFVRSSHLLSRQIDNGAAQRIAWHLRASGIHVQVATQLIAAEIGYGQITLHDDRQATYTFETVVCATGISPNIELAEHAQLQYHLGIEVNDAQQTSDPDIYAIGECSERNGKVAGNLSVTLEQARRAAAAILNHPGSISTHAEVFQLKMDSCVVVTIGDVNDVANDNNKQAVIYAPTERLYRRVFIKNNHVVGAILVGESGFDFGAFTDAVDHQMLWSDVVERRFTKTGQLPHSGNMSPDAVICFCTGTTYGKLAELRKANHSHDSITAQTGASLHCGSCAQRVTAVTATNPHAPAQSARPKAFWTATSLTAILIAASVAAYVIPFAHSWQSPWRLVDVLWRSFVAKQVTGYALLSLMLVAFVPALSRRVQRQQTRPQRLSLMSWHLIAACVVVAGFVVHTGARMGYGLNSVLSLSFTTTLLLGGLASMGWRYASRSQQHRTIANNIRALHWALLFPLPAILVVHILQVYYF